MLQEEWRRAVKTYSVKDVYDKRKATQPQQDYNREKIDKLSRKSFRSIGLLNKAIEEIRKAKEKFNQINKENKTTYDRYNAQELDRRGINRETKRTRKGTMVDIRKYIGNAVVALDTIRRI